jgi:dTDP-glucose pyrophosphorylase
VNARGTHPWEVSVRGTLREAFETLERGGMRIAVVTDDQGYVVGIMTDGDARRALLAGATLDAPLEKLANSRFTKVEPAVGRAEVLELMHARHHDAIPIVDERGLLVGLHQLHDVLGVEKRPNWAIVMAGGRGTRLGAITENTPKPMVRVAGRPIIERIVLHLVGFGIERVFIALNYLGEQIEGHFGDGSRFGCRIEYLREERPLGTAGALALLPEAPTAPVFVINGDLVTQANVGALLDAHVRGGHSLTVGIRPYFHTVPFGCVELDGTRVVRLEEKPRLMRMVSAGMYALSPEVVATVTEGGELTMPALIDASLEQGMVVRAFEVQDDWIDVGQREQLRLARGEDG